MQETNTMQRASNAPPENGGARQGERLMWLTPQRVFYAGLLGAAAERTMGGHGVYVSPAGVPPIRIRIGGGAWQTGELIVVPPQVPHHVESQHPLIFNLRHRARLHLRADRAGLRPHLQGHRDGELRPGRADDAGRLLRPGRHDAHGLSLLAGGPRAIAGMALFGVLLEMLVIRPSWASPRSPS
jgi:hypothetical protein